MDMIAAERLSKTFRVPRGAAVCAVADLSLRVPKGEIFGFLGPNGAGKSTCIGMLTTLIVPTSGRAFIGGHDIHRESAAIRRLIGVLSQRGGSKERATGREQLLLYGRLHRLNADEAQARAERLIASFEMGDYIDRTVDSYSGGQRRRFELATAVIHRPQLLFLDEPTTALDPQSRTKLWDEIQELRSEGTTVFLTTHYMDEADELCDRVAIMDHGRIIALAEPQELKRRMASDIITIRVAPTDVEQLKHKIEQLGEFKEVHYGEDSAHLSVNDGGAFLPNLLRRMNAITSVTLKSPSLGDVFLHLTGRSLRDDTHSHHGE